MPKKLSKREAAEQAAFDACDALRQAYQRGEDNGGSIDWDDLDAAHVKALQALKLRTEADHA